MLTSALTSVDQERCLRAGADRVYAKPMSLPELGGALREALE
jgi:CheY-like chemotaxis protein